MKYEKDSYYIDQILAGNGSVFEHLVNKHKSFVFTIALRIVKDRLDAEEIAQDTFLKVFRSLDKFNRESKFTTWLYSIVYNTAISKTRKKHLEVVQIKDEVVNETIAVEIASQVDELTAQEQKLYIGKVMEQLSGDEANIITLYYLKEQSVEEISEITSLSKSNIKVKLHRARKKLYDNLELILKNETRSIL